MTTEQVANWLVELCREGKYDQVYRELFSPDIVSIEPEGTPNRITRGMDGILKKGKEWQESIETVHSGSVSDPLVADDFFSVNMAMKVTFKGAPGPVEFSEICVYEVKDGKVVCEQFFYTPTPELV